MLMKIRDAMIHFERSRKWRLILRIVSSSWMGYALIFVIALFLRWGWIMLCPILAPAFANPLRGDASAYDALARAIVTGQGFVDAGEPTAFRAPGYPFFLAGVYWFLGSNPSSAQFVQAVLSAFTAILIAYLGKRVAGENVGWLAGIGAAIYYYFYTRRLG